MHVLGDAAAGLLTLLVFGSFYLGYASVVKFLPRRAQWYVLVPLWAALGAGWAYWIGGTVGIILLAAAMAFSILMVTVDRVERAVSLEMGGRVFFVGLTVLILGTVYGLFGAGGLKVVAWIAGCFAVLVGVALLFGRGSKDDTKAPQTGDIE